VIEDRARSRREDGRRPRQSVGDGKREYGPGANLARVVDPARLKAALRVPETQAKDVQLGQRAAIDTRTGPITGRVARVDPASTGGTVTVDVVLDGTMPKGARPDLTIDGTMTCR